MVKFALPRSLSASCFVIFTFPLLMLAMATPSLYITYIGKPAITDIGYAVYFLTYTLICFMVVPCLICRFFLKVSPTEVGLRLPEKSTKNIILMITTGLVLIPFGYYIATQPLVFKFYSHSLGALTLTQFILVQLIMLPIYYVAEEFFFRGFLFLTLWRLVGWHSFWITDVIFTYAHLYKPMLELLLSIPASVVLNYVTLKTKSIYPAMATHTLLGFLLNMTVYFHLQNAFS